eukprot:SAG22_NODE_71_length_22540_cov_8.918052_9_plen_100_part_00
MKMRSDHRSGSCAKSSFPSGSSSYGTRKYRGTFLSNGLKYTIFGGHRLPPPALLLSISPSEPENSSARPVWLTRTARKGIVLDKKTVETQQKGSALLLT